MTALIVTFVLIGLVVAYSSSLKYMRARLMEGRNSSLAGQPKHYALCFTCLCALAAALSLALIQISLSDNRIIVHPIVPVFLLSALVAVVFYLARNILKPRFQARRTLEKILTGVLFLCTSLSIATAIAIILSMLIESIHFFTIINPIDFFFTTNWSPRFSTTETTADFGSFGLIPLLWGTFYISLIAVSLATLMGLMTAIYLNQYALPQTRSIVKPLIEILAGIPTVVYGFFALTFFGPLLNAFGQTIGVDIETTSVLTAGMIMGIMLIPFMSSLSEDVMNAIPRPMIESAYGLGATKSETVKHIIIPAAFPGLVGAFTLTFSRAVGETMIVVMAAGIAANLSLNPFEPMTTVTVKIVSQLTGDFEFNTPQTLVAFALGLTLFIITFIMNATAFHIAETFHRRYQ